MSAIARFLKGLVEFVKWALIFSGLVKRLLAEVSVTLIIITLASGLEREKGENMFGICLVLLLIGCLVLTFLDCGLESVRGLSRLSWVEVEQLLFISPLRFWIVPFSDSRAMPEMLTDSQLPCSIWTLVVFSVSNGLDRFY